MQWPAPKPDRDPIAFERADLTIPHLPAELEGFTILQIGDTHVSHRSSAGRALHTQLLHQLDCPETDLPPIDLCVLSGDYMSRDGDEPMATQTLRDLVHTSAKLTRLGCFGVFGNHDHAELKDSARERTHSEHWPVRWMHRKSHEIEGLPLQIMGSDWPETFEPLSAERPEILGKGAPLRLALGHSPDCTPDAHRAGAHLLLAGHTHGGQIRLPMPGGGVLAGFTSSSLIPLHAPAGVYRFRHDGTPQDRETTLGVTRGVGYQQLPIRIHCPPQVVVYTLRRAEVGSAETNGMPPEPAGTKGKLEILRVW